VPEGVSDFLDDAQVWRPRGGVQAGAATRRAGRCWEVCLSFVSLTCLGCNDITPESKVARMLLKVESTTGVLDVAVLIAQLVALYSHSVERGTDRQT